MPALAEPASYRLPRLTLLIAPAMGCAASAATTSSLPEVAGEAALLVDPRDACALADAMKQVLLEESVRDTLRARGLARAGEFSWVKTARETLRAYRDDRFHPPAREAWEEQVSGGAILITSNYVVLESTALLQHRIGMKAVAPSHKMTTIFETTIT